MIGRLYNKMRKEMRDSAQLRAKIKPFEIGLVAKSLRHLWNTDEPISDTRMIKCDCGNKKRFHVPIYAKNVAFKCKKCGRRQVLKL